ncbi:MAG: hypothetical protein KDD51_10750 [Bdellovibrionales bacterium]|nr:hypothetical protein [Bdellovibrionales bacterium]
MIRLLDKAIGCIEGLAILGAAMLFAQPAFATLDDVLRAEQQKRDSAVERFSQFTSDKNVMGDAMSPDGKVIQSRQKQRFDQDGGKLLSFQSDLTYHANYYDINEEVNDKGNGKSTVRKLYGGISSHGKGGSGTGSSALERAVYGLHEQFNQEEDAQKPEEEGVEFRSVFKVTTKEVAPQKNGNQGKGVEGENDQITVRRWELRDEALQAVKKVGDDSADTVINAAKDQEAKGDDQQLANGVLLLEAGQRNQLALKAQSLRALTQRRVNRAIRGGKGLDRLQLNEAAARCDDGVQQLKAQAAELAQSDPAKAADLEQEIQRMESQCRQITAENYRTIMPRFKEDGQGEEKLQALGVNDEDGRERDLRVQLEMNEKFGIGPNQVQNNWGYKGKDGKGLVTLAYDENGNPTKQQLMSPAEQLEVWNNDLQQTKQAVDEVNARLPEENQIDTSNLFINSARPGEKPAYQITKIPDAAREDYFIKNPSPIAQKPFGEYGDLLQ